MYGQFFNMYASVETTAPGFSVKTIAFLSWLSCLSRNTPKKQNGPPATFSQALLLLLSCPVSDNSKALFGKIREKSRRSESREQLLGCHAVTQN